VVKVVTHSHLVVDWGTLTLPLGGRFSPDDLPSLRRGSDSVPHGEPGAAKQKSVAILLVEDDVALGAMYLRRLQHEGYTITWATDGEEASRLLRDVAFDLVILDVGLPFRSGLSILRDIREDASLRQVPVVMLSNYSEPEIMEQARELGATEYLVKANVTPSHLAEGVRGWI
jgi:CheY-like chemotaxis protein